MYYRKYRPQSISQLDNERIKDTLGKALLSGKFAHAYLLTGPKGIGKTTTARIIAKFLNCQERKPGEEPCNKCDSCVSISEGRSLDVIEIDAASNTSVDDVRDLREKAKLSPTSSPYKVYIIDEVHMLSNSAFNALLKILEEPPSHVVFVLATTDPQELPETVISRCQRYDFGKASVEEISAAVKRAAKGEKLEITDKAVTAIAEMADGSLRDGHKILEQLASQGDRIDDKDVLALRPLVQRDTVNEFVKLLAEKNAGEAIAWLSRYYDQNKNLKEFTSALAGELRHELLISEGIESGKQSTELSGPEIAELLKMVDRSYAELRDTVIPTLPLELLAVEWSQHGKSKPVVAAVPEKKEDSHKKTEAEPEEKPKTAKEPEKKEKDDDEPDSSAESRMDEPSDALFSSGDNVNSEQWKELLSQLKPLNHSLVAFMRAAKPSGFSGNYLLIKVAYKFHLEKLSEERNRRAVEKALSGIMGKPILVKLALEKK